MKISISGTHSVGKSTLIRDLCATELQFSAVQEVARKMVKEGFKMSTEITEYGVVNYAKRYLEIERNSINDDLVIFDRSLIDLLAYIRVNGDYKIRKPFIDLVYEIVYLESKSFDFYVYIPPEIPFEFDGVRPLDLQYRDKVDKEIYSLLREFDLNYYEITGTPKSRLSKVLALIEEN